MPTDSPEESHWLVPKHAPPRWTDIPQAGIWHCQFQRHLVQCVDEAKATIPHFLVLGLACNDI